VDVLKKQALVGTARKALSICGCAEKAGVSGHNTQRQGTLNLWMCSKSWRWWAQHAKARHFQFVDVLKKQALVGTTRKGKALSICGCAQKAGVGGHNTQRQGTFNLWMC